MNTFTTRFAGFEHDATELSAYIFSIDMFIISLKNEEIIHFTAPEPELFRQWLEYHKVRNVNETLGKMVYEHYFGKKKG